jgi:two-component system, LytTR family, response regulator
MTAPVRVLIVDDEPNARAGLAALLKRVPGFTLAGLCPDGHSAVKAIADSAPDLVLLDVQMPEMSGFDVVRAVGPEDMPPTIFVTAHETHALEAFRVAALDYVLKPFDDRRMIEALERARTHRNDRRYSDLGRRLLNLVATDTPPEPVRFAVRAGARTVLVPAEEIEWIEASNYYARLHVGRETYLLRESMQMLEARLDPARFIRTHRSAIVQLQLIAALERKRLGNHSALLRSGARVPVGRQRWTMVSRAVSERR